MQPGFSQNACSILPSVLKIFKAEVFALKTLSQQAFLIKDNPTGLKLDSRLISGARKTKNLFFSILINTAPVSLWHRFNQNSRGAW